MFFQSLNLYSILVAGLTATVIVFMRQLYYYKQQIINKDLKIIPAYFDKKMLYKILNNNCDRYSALEMIKSYFKLKTARSLSYEELEKMLIYVKVPYIMTQDDQESLNTFIHLAKIM